MANGFGLVSGIVPQLVVQVDGNGDPIAPTGAATPLFKVGVSPFVAPEWPGTAYAITSMFFCNRGQAPAKLTVFLVPKDKAYPSSTTAIIQSLNIANGDTFSFDTEKIILGAEDAVWASSDQSAAINAILSVVRVA